MDTSSIISDLHRNRQVPSLSELGCASVLKARSHPGAAQWLRVYLDGSWDDLPTSSAAILCWGDGTTPALSIPCPLPGSKDAEFLTFVQCVRYLQWTGFRGFRGVGGVNSGIHPPRILAYPQTDKCPIPPGGGGVGLTPTRPPTHPPTYPTPAQTTKHRNPFMGVGQTEELWGSSVAPFASSTNDKAS